MAIVLIERITPRTLVKVRNVFGLLRTVKITITIRIAISRPPMRRPAAMARPDHGSPAGRGAAAARRRRGPGLLSAMPVGRSS